MSEQRKQKAKVGGKPTKSGLTNRPSTRVNQKAFLQEYYACGFNQTKACSNLGISRETVRKWRLEDPEFERQMNESVESLVDSAEEQLRQQVAKGNMDAIKFTLSRLGKNRGYVERTEVTGQDSGPIEITITKTIVGRKQV
jgi:CRP-like cAMP-binding protein